MGYQFKTLAILGALTLASCAHAPSDLKFAANLSGAAETPANDSAATGSVTATLDPATKVFNYTVVYSGLSGPPLAAHFHGPAAPGAGAPPTLPVPAPLASPIKGTATLTDAQVTALTGGLWYFNIHTDAHKPGEVRGQVLAK